ncbi:MAG TPA: DNA replication/repair protein RecF [Acidobacteriota bacterium]|nr:DNA replication/repair protein RecF [Acidobacteriota bacterium]
MQLLKLRVYNYRNLRQQEIELSAGMNLFCGLNGHGKTNLLEAIYLLGYGKSFRTSKPRECIRHEENECAVEGSVAHGGMIRSLQVSIASDAKRLIVNGKTVPVDEFVGLFHVTAFTSAHLGIVRGGPGERRAFLDRAMVTLFPGHLRLLASYGRAVRQRNRILSQRGETQGRNDDALLDSWDETLSGDGARILLNRLRYVQRLKEELQCGLFGAETLKIHYLSTVAEENATEIERIFRERLLSVRAADIRNGFTSVGPHRDDLKLYADGRSLGDYGSAGQQRSCLLELYFAQMEIHRKEQGFFPVFLFDDIEGELDDRRLKILLGHLSDRTQTFLTSAKGALVPTLPGTIRRFEVNEGVVTSG